MRRIKYFGTKNKNNLDKNSYVRCLTQRNCKGLKVNGEQGKHVNYVKHL